MFLRTLLFFFLTLCLNITILSQAFASDDSSSEVFIDDIFVSTNLQFLPEDNVSNFSLDQSSFSMLWGVGWGLSGVLRLGSLGLINTQEIFQEELPKEWGSYEAYLQYNHGSLGRIRMGLIPLEFGLEGGVLESQLLLPRNQIFSKRVSALRDYGLSYFIETQYGFYTRLIVHNGESAKNQDGELYYSAAWGWSGDFMDMGLSGYTGLTRPNSTLGLESDLGGVDLTMDAKWKVGAAHFRWDSGLSLAFSLEYLMGKVEQEDNSNEFAMGNVSLEYRLTDRTALLTRYDKMDPNKSLHGDQQTEISLGLIFWGKSKNARLSFVATRALEQSIDLVNDRYGLTWSFSPRIRKK